MSWQEIESQRKQNENNPNYPHIYWKSMKKGILHVKVGEFEQDLEVKKAVELFKDNKFFMSELAFLTETNEIDMNLIPPEDLHIRNIKRINEEIIEEIIDTFGFKPTDDISTQIKYCCQLHKYISETNEYVEELGKERDTYPPQYIVDMDLYNALYNHAGVCTSNSVMFRAILSRLGIDVKVVLLFSNDREVHAANIVKLGDEYYFFDTTTEMAVYDIEKNNDFKEHYLLFAGLGSKDYYESYIPQFVFPEDPFAELEPIPENIALDSMDLDYVNQIAKKQNINTL